MYLIREEAQAGALCRGCGLPAVVILGERPLLMHLTDQERAEYDAARPPIRQRTQTAEPTAGALADRG